MALAPIVGRAALKRKGPYRNAKGQFTTRANYLREQRRLSSGKLGTYAQASKEQRREANFRAQLGGAPAGKSWVSIANKYPDRFEDYDLDQ